MTDAFSDSQSVMHVYCIAAGDIKEARSVHSNVCLPHAYVPMQKVKI